MKMSSSFLALLLISFSAMAQAQITAPTPGLSPVPVPSATPLAEPIAAAFETAFVPPGFDSNDNSQIVAEGHFTDTCYRVEKPLVKVDQVTKTITIEAQGYKINGYCFIYPTAFDQTINLGRLNVGDYTIKSIDGAKTYNMLSVAAATSPQVGDAIYPYVTQTYVANADGKNSVVVEGDYDSTCLKMAPMKITSNTNVVVVEPAFEKIGFACAGAMTPFSASADLDPALKGRFLIHVRAQQGTAVNAVVDIK